MKIRWGKLLYALAFWLPLFALLEDIGFVLFMSLARWQWYYPNDYTWLIKYWGWFGWLMSRNWYFPSAYWFGTAWLILVYAIKKVNGNKLDNSC